MLVGFIAQKARLRQRDCLFWLDELKQDEYKLI